MRLQTYAFAIFVQFWKLARYSSEKNYKLRSSGQLREEILFLHISNINKKLIDSTS